MLEEDSASLGLSSPESLSEESDSLGLSGLDDIVEESESLSMPDMSLLSEGSEPSSDPMTESSENSLGLGMLDELSESTGVGNENGSDYTLSDESELPDVLGGLEKAADEYFGDGSPKIYGGHKVPFTIKLLDVDRATTPDTYKSALTALVKVADDYEDYIKSSPRVETCDNDTGMDIGMQSRVGTALGELIAEANRQVALL